MPSRLPSKIWTLKTKLRDAISPTRESFEHKEAAVFDYSRHVIDAKQNFDSPLKHSKMGLTVLTDANVKDILQSLDREELMGLQSSLREALHEYATGTTSSGAAAANQPNRTVIESNSGTTTLFMPSQSSSSIGMKGMSNQILFLQHILTLLSRYTCGATIKTRGRCCRN